MLKMINIILLFCINVFSLSLKERRFLDVIAYAEGTYENYNITYCYKTFDSFKVHPNVIVCCSGICSSAAGRYQFLYSTYQSISKKIDLKDFTPSSQDNAALYLIKSKGVNIEDIKDYATFKEAIYKLNRVWAALPKSPYGQPTRRMSKLWQKWKELK